MELLKRKITSAGSACLVCGIISIVTGLATGTILLAHGGRLLAERRHCDALREQLYGSDL